MIHPESHLLPTAIRTYSSSSKSVAMHTVSPLALLTWLALAITTAAAPHPSSCDRNHASKRIGVQAHRGGLGHRSEESLWAFAYSLELGVDTLELDVVFTSDGIPVAWHDNIIPATKCKGEHIGKFVANLTLAEVKTMDCSVQLSNHRQQKTHPLTRIATLEETLDLVSCYGDKNVGINLETKLDPENPGQTLGVERYINDIVPILERKGFATRTTIQSFDWRTLVGIKNKWPCIKTVALVDETTVVPNKEGAYPWLNGIQLDTEFGGDWVAAAASIGASFVSPVHGAPSSATVNTPGYVPFVTKNIVQRAHELKMEVVPWTVDDEATIEKLIEDGVDSIISNYPQRVMWIAKDKGLKVGQKPNKRKPQCLAKAAKGL